LYKVLFLNKAVYNTGGLEFTVADSLYLVYPLTFWGRGSGKNGIKIDKATLTIWRWRRFHILQYFC